MLDTTNFNQGEVAIHCYVTGTSSVFSHNSCYLHGNLYSWQNNHAQRLKYSSSNCCGKNKMHKLTKIAGVPSPKLQVCTVQRPTDSIARKSGICRVYLECVWFVNIWLRSCSDFPKYGAWNLGWRAVRGLEGSWILVSKHFSILFVKDTGLAVFEFPL